MDTINFGTFSIDSIPTRALEFKIMNPTDKKIIIHGFETNTYLFNLFCDGLPKGVSQNSYWGSSEKDILLAPGKHVSILFQKDERRFHKDDVNYKDIHLDICYGDNYEHKEIPIVFNVIPNIKWENEILNKGSIKQGDTVRAVFRFENTSANTIHWESAWFDNSDKNTVVVFPKSILPHAKDSVVFIRDTHFTTDSVFERIHIQNLYYGDEDPVLGTDITYELYLSYVIDSVTLFSTIDFEETQLYKTVDTPTAYLNYEFKFKNKGTAPLIIYMCRGSSGCVVPTCPREPILPGQEGKIIVTYDASRKGSFTKTVSVSSNARNKRNCCLIIRGVVN